MDPENIEQAAHARAKGISARADRPSERRCASERGAGAWVSARAPRIQLREADDSTGPLHFEGYATVYERGYEMWDYYGPYPEIVEAGAGALSLARADLDVPLVLQHQSLQRIARTLNGTLTLTEDENGLLVDAPALDREDKDVAYIAPKLRAGLIDEMSFMFRITAGQWSPDYSEYRIKSYDIHRGDVAIVGYGANPHTAGSGIRSKAALDIVRGLDDSTAHQALTELRSRFPGTPRGARGVDLITHEDELHLPLV